MINIGVSITHQLSASELPDDGEPPSWIRACLDNTIIRDALRGRPAYFSLAYLDESAAQDLNQRFRGKNNPTNVLSFAADLPQCLIGAEDFTLSDFTLGDIVICPPVVAREACEQHKRFHDHFTHLVIHGFLHLLGFDHMTPEQACEMEALEIQTLKQLGIANPYLTRPCLESSDNQTSKTPRLALRHTQAETQ